MDSRMHTVKKSVCNELFGSLELSRVCTILKENGFDGIELAPYTIAQTDGSISPARVDSVRKTLEAHHLEFTGFHWLLARPSGLHFTSAEPEVRKQAIGRIRDLLFISGDLGGGNLIFGSPAQRAAQGIPVEDGLEYFIQGLAELADTARQNQSVICIEALSHADTNILNTLAEAEKIIRRIDHSAIQSMFDFHNCADETLPWPELIEQFSSIIRHVHLNRTDGTHPVRNDLQTYQPTFAALKNISYSGWISLEIFTVPEDPEAVVRETAAFLNLVL
jgi:D-psicose/D-tagatose/L-ribulose 3-epimerase